MKTDQLISALAADTTPRPDPRRRMAVGLAGAIVTAGAALLLFWGPRVDLAAAMTGPAVIKTLAPLVLAVAAVALSRNLALPGSPVRARAMVLAGLVAAALAVLGVAVFRAGAGALVAALDTPSLAVCLRSVPLLALAPLLAMLWALRAGAPLSPGRTGAVAGLAAGAVAAAVYSIYCNQDALLFYLPAYGAGIAMVTLLGALLGARFLRW